MTQTIHVSLHPDCPREYELGQLFPSRGSDEAAGYDLRAALSAPVELLPGQRALVPTGLIFWMQPGMEAQVRPRSGLAFKHGVTVLNTPGTIDSDYTGHVQVILVNLGQETFLIEPGMRIAQVVFSKLTPVELFEGAAPRETGRGGSGFGSSGT